MSANANIRYLALDKLREAKRLTDPDHLPFPVSAIALTDRCVKAWVLIAEAIPDLEQPQETEATEEPEPADDFARHARRAGEEGDWQWLDRPKLFACTHGHCYYCKVCKFRMGHPWSGAQREAHRLRSEGLCTCDRMGGFSSRCPVHGARVDRTPIGC